MKCEFLANQKEKGIFSGQVRYFSQPEMKYLTWTLNVLYCKIKKKKKSKSFQSFNLERLEICCSDFFFFCQILLLKPSTQ